MIKVMGFLRRNEKTSHQELLAHWQSVHAPNVARAAKPERYAITFFDSALDGSEAAFDGLASLWMRDMQHFQTAFSPEAVKETNADGFTELIEPSAAVTLFTEEHPILGDAGPRGPSKLTFAVARKAGVDAAEFRRAWLDIHAPNVAAVLREAGANGYAVSLVSGPEGARYDGVAELFFPDDDTREAALAKLAVQDAWTEMADRQAMLTFRGSEVRFV